MKGPEESAEPAAAAPVVADVVAPPRPPRRSTRAEVETIDQAIIDRILPARLVEALRLPADFVPLFAEACYVFGLDPNPSKKPRQLLSHRLLQGDPDAVPPEVQAVSLVTGGGRKLRYPIDEDTERMLREIFQAFRVRGGKREELPLPADLALPLEALDGVVRTTAHRFAGGYLAGGGKEEADRRAILDAIKQAGRTR